MENFKLIPLGKSGKFAIVDAEDYEWLIQWKWSYRSEYASRTASGNKYISMHRLINQTPEGFDTDHINRNKLDNRRLNLRTATRSENQRNTPAPKHNTSGYKGVHWNKKRQKWVAQTWDYKKPINIGGFEKVEDAAKAYDDYCSATKEEKEKIINCRKAKGRNGSVGVNWDARRKNWKAEIWKNGKNHYIGSFKNKEDAIAARKAWELSHQSSAEP